MEIINILFFLHDVEQGGVISIILKKKVVNILIQ